MKENLTDEIIERAIKGDRAAYDVIYRSCEGRLRSYITSHLNDKSQADDVLQNTFISVYNNISRLRSPEGFKKWIFTIAYNECMSVNNNVKKEQEHFISISTFTDEDGTEREFEDDSLELPEDYATNKELQKLLADELNALTSKQRDCLILYYYKHKSIPEIAKMYGLSESAIKNRKEKAIEKLKRRLEKYRGRYNFAFVPLGGLMGKLVGTGKVKSACLGTAVVKSATAGVVAAAMIGAVGIAGIGYLNYMGDNKPDQNNLPDQSIVIEDKSDSEEDILKEYEMPEELKNKEWTDVEFPENAYITKYLINNVAENVPLAEDGIEDYRLLRLSDFRYTDSAVQFIFTPKYSKPEDYTMFEPKLHFRAGTSGYTPLRQTLGKEKLDNQEYTMGNLYFEDGKVVFSFEHIYEDIPELKNCTFEGGDSFRFGSVAFKLENGAFADYVIGAETKNIWGIPDPPMLEDYGDRYSEYQEDFKEYKQKYEIEPYYLEFYTGGAPYPTVTKYGTMNLRRDVNIGEYFPNQGVNYSTCFLERDGSITIENGIPVSYLGNYDINGNPVVDPYGQSPYDKIKKINSRGSLLYEENNGIIYYDKREYLGADEQNGPQYSDPVERTLLWLPPDTHYDYLQLPDKLTSYYSDEALQRLNADHIYLGADSEGFVQQLENSSDEKAQAILAQIRADNDI